MTDSHRALDPSLFDTSTSLAEDFYRYVNGGWLDTHPVPPEYGAWGSFHEVTERNQMILHRLLEEAAGEAEEGADVAQHSTPDSPRTLVGDYFATAMNEQAIVSAGVKPLQPFLARIAALDSVADLKALSVYLQRIGVDVFHSLGIASDFENSDAYLVYLGQGGLGLPERDYYTRDDEHSAELRVAYVAHVANQLRNLGYADDEATRAADDIMAFESRLATASHPAEKMRDVQLTMNRHEVSALDELMPDFGLSSYAASLGATLPTVNVDNPDFFRALEAALEEIPLEVLRHYLRWRLVASFASSLPPAFENEAFDFFGRRIGGQQEMRPRWKRVLDAATADIGEAVAQLYVDAAFSEDAKKRCEEMVAHLLSAMEASIRNAEWMTEATKEQALAKLAGFGYKIGFPDEWRDYSALEIGRDSFAANRIRAAAFEYDREFGRLGKPVDKSEWAMPAHQVNAYFHPLLNEIVFPAGILQPPFFYAEADDAVNFGAIGAVIGHEITHGFDDRGSQFDASGALRNWWTEEDRIEFERRAEVLVEQYAGYEVLDGLNINGRLSLGENIADLGGVTIAYNALLESLGDNNSLVDGYTPEQRFFLSYATMWRTNHTDEQLRMQVSVHPHSPGRFRVNGVLANLPEFAAAFDISTDSPMVRPDELRAKIW